MKTLKSLGDINNLHDLRSIPRTRRSAKPQLSTTAVLNLSMARNERERLVKERMRLSKRKLQVERRLVEVDDEMDALLKQAKKTATEIRGQAGVPVNVKVNKEKHSKPKMVLDY